METSGKIAVERIELEKLTIHCVMSPEDGESVNSQVLETEKNILIVDTLLLKPYAEQLRQYVDGLGKRVFRVITTHSHPDHWFGLEYFDRLPHYALKETIQEIRDSGDQFLEIHRKKHGDEADQLIPAKKVIPSNIMGLTPLTIDGVRVEFQKVTNSETRYMVVPEVPEYKVLLGQDLLYNKVHLFIGGKTSDGKHCFDDWMARLQEFQQKDYEILVPGHGKPAGPELFQEMIKYLQYAKNLFESSLDAETLKRLIMENFSDYTTPMMLDMSNWFLYHPDAEI